MYLNGAIYSCLSRILNLPHQKKSLILTDSPLFSAIHLRFLLNQPYHSTHSLSTNKSPATFIWIPGGHVDFSEHDAVDQAAKQASKFPKITDNTLWTASDLKIYYRSHIITSWRNLWT